MKRFTTICALTAGAAQASILWEQLDNYLLDKSMANLEQLFAWQIASLIIPLFAGPMRVVSYIYWNVAQGQSADVMKAYLYFYDITTTDQFWGYWMDYFIYG